MKAEIIIIFLTFILSACINRGDLKLFPIAKSEIEAAPKILLIVDCYILEKKSTDTAIFRDSLNRPICNHLAESVEKELQKRSITNYEVLSVSGGFQTGPGPIDENGNHEATYFPVYFSDNKIAYKPVELYFRSIAKSLVPSTIQGSKGRETYLKSLPQWRASHLHKMALEPKTIVAFVLFEGNSVPIEETIGEAVASTVLTLGMVTAFHHSTFSGRIVMLKRTGDTVWADAAYLQSIPIQEKDLELFVNKLFSYFPLASNEATPET